MRAQSSAPPSASISALALEEHWLPRKRWEEEVEQVEQRRIAAPPPGPKAPKTEPSVQTVRSAGGRESRWEEATRQRTRAESVRAQGVEPNVREI